MNTATRLSVIRHPAPWCGRRGFTLIEILVVVAIIALLISILLPSLKASREQSRRVACMANLKSLGVASTAYMGDNKGRFYWGRVDVFADGSRRAYPMSHAYGGNRGKGEAPNWEFYGPGGSYDIPAAKRPLNRYVTGHKTGDRSDLKVYQCNSDKGVRNRTDVMIPASRGTAYEVTGTSYLANTIWYQYSYVKEFKKTKSPEFELRIADLMDRITPIFEKKGASRAMLMMEDPADSSIAGVLNNWERNLKVDTWHGRANSHNLLFLDGHADSTLTDYKRNLDHNFNGAGGAFNASCNPEHESCKHGEAKWFARQDYMQQ